MGGGIVYLFPGFGVDRDHAVESYVRDAFLEHNR